MKLLIMQPSVASYHFLLGPNIEQALLLISNNFALLMFFRLVVVNKLVFTSLVLLIHKLLEHFEFKCRAVSLCVAL
jgi:hypothetical protein